MKPRVPAPAGVPPLAVFFPSLVQAAQRSRTCVSLPWTASLEHASLERPPKPFLNLKCHLQDYAMLENAGYDYSQARLPHCRRTIHPCQHLPCSCTHTRVAMNRCDSDGSGNCKTITVPLRRNTAEGSIGISVVYSQLLVTSSLSHCTRLLLRAYP